MKKINIHFERDPSLREIDVTIRASEKDETVSALIDKLSAHPPDRITVFDGYGNLRTLKPEEIITITVEGRLLCLLTAQGSWYTRQTLQSLEETLDKKRFLRISRYEIINVHQVQRYDFTVVGTLRIVLADGTETWASRRCIPAIRRKLTGKE